MRISPRVKPSVPRRSLLASFAVYGLFAGTLAARLCALGSDSGPVVEISGGSVRGRLLPAGAGTVFKGIPFAQPPVGDLRWREPLPVVPWTGIREANRSGPPAEQPALGWNDKAAAASSEDCLYLDVWTPGPDPSARRPVMVWIHGGGNVAGAGGFDPLYDGRALIGRGVVLVVVEYRLGIFGFFSHPELTRESPHHASGNYGILDQIAALRWVRGNVAKFGGDPGNVTVFGQSAGAMDVMALMASPLSDGLFQRAISESGPLNPQMTQPLAEAEQAGARAVEKLKGPLGKDLHSLRLLAPAELMAAGRGLRPFVADGWVFPASPFEVWRARREHAVPLILGSNAVEFPFGGSPLEFATSVRDFFGDLAPRALSLYGLGGAPRAPDPLYGNAADQWGSDLFRCIGIVEGGWHSDAGHSSWLYEFDRAIPPHARVAHSGDLPYVFGNLYATGSLGGDYREEDRRLSDTMQGYWTNFARTGNPNGPGLPEWGKYDAAGREYLDFTVGAEGILRNDERGPFTELFREAMDRTPSAP